MSNTKEVTTEYILREFLNNEKPESLTDSTPLITSGILDSLGTIKLVTFLSDKFDIDFQPHEIDVEYLNTVADITKLVDSKL